MGDPGKEKRRVMLSVATRSPARFLGKNDEKLLLTLQTVPLLNASKKKRSERAVTEAAVYPIQAIIVRN